MRLGEEILNPRLWAAAIFDMSFGEENRYSHISLKCLDGRGIVIAPDSAAVSCAVQFTEFARLTGAGLQEGALEPAEVSCAIRLSGKTVFPWTKLFTNFNHALCVHSETGVFEVQVREWALDEGRLPVSYAISTWRLALLGGILREVLLGRPLFLIHGALLSSSRGNLLLTGQSGIGKSTTSRRWIEAGGIARADDMSLLEIHEDSVWAHPLPTWSRCQMEGTEKLCYPFNPPLHVDNLMILGRHAEREQVKEVSEWEFLQSLYSAVILFYTFILRNMPEGVQRKILAILQARAEYLCGKYPHRALLAHLSGDIQTTLKEFL